MCAMMQKLRIFMIFFTMFIIYKKSISLEISKENNIDMVVECKIGYYFYLQ